MSLCTESVTFLEFDFCAEGAHGRECSLYIKAPVSVVTVSSSAAGGVVSATMYFRDLMSIDMCVMMFVDML